MVTTVAVDAATAIHMAIAICTTKEQSKERKEFGGRNYELFLFDYNHIWDVRINPV